MPISDHETLIVDDGSAYVFNHLCGSFDTVATSDISPNGEDWYTGMCGLTYDSDGHAEYAVVLGGRTPGICINENL